MPITYEPIATTTLGTAASTITFSSIAATYTDLRIVLNGRTSTTAGTYVSIRFNGDTGSNYSYTKLSGNTITASSTGGSGSTPYINEIDSSGVNPYLIEVDIFSYAGSTNKTLLTTAAMDRNGAGSVEKTVILWRNTSAINSVTLRVASGDNFQTNTTATLYGIKNA